MSSPFFNQTPGSTPKQLRIQYNITMQDVATEAGVTLTQVLLVDIGQADKALQQRVIGALYQLIARRKSSAR